MKEQVDTVNATPRKRLFLSVIRDHNLNTGICELVDNAVDAWNIRGRKAKLVVRVTIDADQRTIRIHDNAGGVPKDELDVIVAPGLTGNDLNAPTIGLFGVGSKRAVVALAKDIRIHTRHGEAPTYGVEFDETWLHEEGQDGWLLPVFKVSDIEPGSTAILLQQLRVETDPNALTDLERHLGRTYAKFLAAEEVSIILETTGAKEVQAETFEAWAYPPDFGPRRYTGHVVVPDEKEKVQVEILAGLSSKSSPSGQYGVYLYCNDRLVFAQKRDFSVGFSSDQAGLPHPGLSLLRVIVNLNGPAGLMPWNSSKTDVNTDHVVYRRLREQLVTVVTDFASLSRRFQGDWEHQVFQYTDGPITEVEVGDMAASRKSYLPKLPPAVRHYDERIRRENQKLVKDKPWLRGLYEGVVAAEYIFRKTKLEQRNRVCLIILDSTLEIAFKEYLVKVALPNTTDAQVHDMFQRRESVIKAMRKNAPAISDDDWTLLAHYYDLRCSLVHERATATIPDPEIETFRALTIRLLSELFGLGFSALAGPTTE